MFFSMKFFCYICLLAMLTSCSAVKKADVHSKSIGEQEKQVNQRLVEMENKTQALERQLESIESAESSSIVGVSSKGLSEASIEIDELEARIEQIKDGLNRRPRRKFVGGRPKDARMALYVEAWRQKVETMGNENYPKEASDKKMYGKVRLTASIKSDGTLEKVELNKSSGFSVLDNHAIEAVKKAAPYSPFEESLRKDVDVLGITRTFNYTTENVDEKIK